MGDGRAYSAERSTKWLGNLLVIFIGICQWIYAFILTTCVFMAGGGVPPASPEIEIDFSGRATALRTIFLLALIGVTWLGAYSFIWRRRWAWYYTWALGIFLLGIGLYAHWTSRGALEAFVGQGSLRQTTGLVVAWLAVSALIVLPLPLVRQQFFATDGFDLGQ